MGTITRNLLWKEWREQQGKLLAAGAILSAFILFPQFSREIKARVIYMFAVVMAAAFFPIFVAMGLVASERSRKTFSTLQAMPVSPWRLLAIKTALGILVCIIPIAAITLLGLTAPGHVSFQPAFYFRWAEHFLFSSPVSYLDHCLQFPPADGNPCRTYRIGGFGRLDHISPGSRGLG